MRATTRNPLKPASRFPGASSGRSTTWSDGVPRAGGSDDELRGPSEGPSQGPFEGPSAVLHRLTATASFPLQTSVFLRRCTVRHLYVRTKPSRDTTDRSATDELERPRIVSSLVVVAS
jgi:hypothetical protein